ncbi:MAG TPA: hypothetical protein VJN18_23170 [Polyangiaceae bacterium]|nr:hypothetical protein [Polyangiaceae bacterium]
MLPGRRARDLAIVLKRVVAVLLALELLYLATGNLVVRSGLIKQAVASAEGFHLDYGRAYTLWPGRVEVSDLAVRVEDYNVQFEVAFDRAQVDISLSDLLLKRFRVTRLEAEGTRFRMRHKLLVVGDDAERVAAYPPIRGFADPPYYVGIRPAGVSDEEAAELWEVRIENVAADVSELWVMEYRFRGEASVAGSFVVRPTRWVQVLPATLRLERARLTLGEHVVAEQVSGRIDCQVPDYSIQATEGRQVFREISTQMDVKLSRGKLDFLRAYLARFGPLRYSGDASWQLALQIEKGKVMPGSNISLLATPLRLIHPAAELAGDVTVSLGRSEGPTSDRLSLAVSAPRFVTETRRQGAPGPILEGVAAGLLLDAVDLSSDMAVGDGQLAAKNARAPSLTWFQTQGTKLTGQASAQLSVAHDSQGALLGRASFSSPDLGLRHDALVIQTAVSGSLTLARGAGERELQARELQLELNQTTLESGGERSKPFGLALEAAGLRITPGASPSARGLLHVRASSAAALLPLVVGDLTRKVSDAALDLEGLEARAQLDIAGNRAALSRIDGRSGRLRVRGHLEKRGQYATGALLLSSGFINMGVILKGGNTELLPLVGDDWLSQLSHGGST